MNILSTTGIICCTTHRHHYNSKCWLVEQNESHRWGVHTSTKAGSPPSGDRWTKSMHISAHYNSLGCKCFSNKCCVQVPVAREDDKLKQHQEHVRQTHEARVLLLAGALNEMQHTKQQPQPVVKLERIHCPLTLSKDIITPCQTQIAAACSLSVRIFIRFADVILLLMKTLYARTMNSIDGFFPVI